MHFLFGFILLMIVVFVMTYIRYKTSDNEHRISKIRNSQKSYIREFNRLKEEHTALSNKIKQYEQRRDQRNNQQCD